LNRLLPLLLALIGGTLLSIGWPPLTYTPLLFVAWIPLLWMEEKVKGKWLFLGLTYLHLLIWNILTTWWIWHASGPGAIAAIVTNSLLMCLPWMGYRYLKNRKGIRFGLLGLIAGWMSFEYLHLQDWGLSWPWLTLGNGLATQPNWIQWYEYTGTSGGSLWIWVVNALLFLQFRQRSLPADAPRKPYRWIALAAIGIPIGVSYWIKSTITIEQNDASHEVVLLQPNIDPYEKVSSYTSFPDQLTQLIKSSEAGITDSTTLLIWPETALYQLGGIGEKELKERSPRFDSLWKFLARHPKMKLFTGVESYAVVKEKSINSIPAPDWLQIPGTPSFLEAYNGAALLDSSGARSFYHKSKLVPGVETLPGFLHILDAWFEKFGGTSGGYTPQQDRTVLESDDGFRLAPAICYESIYGEHISRYFKKEANLMVIITNDGWWQNTSGHKQHWLYARLRAIENRRWVARSANTGISGFIDPMGNEVSPQPYDTEACIRFAIPIQLNAPTFYAQTGDILSKLICAFLLGLWIWAFVTRRRS